MQKILLMRATLKNLKDIAALERLASSKTYSARTSEKEIRNFIKDESVFLIKTQKDIVGLVAYEVIKKKLLMLMV